MYSSFQNKTLTIDYGDGTVQSLKVNSGLFLDFFSKFILFKTINLLLICFKVMDQGYTIPTNLSTVKSLSGSSFLLLNTEFSNDTNLYGFELFAATTGSITLQV
jgi:hypothetical protein